MMSNRPPRTTLRRLIGSAIVCTALLAPAAAVQAKDDLEPVEPVVSQTDAEALEEDLALTAEALGWTVAEARAQYEAGEAVEVVARAVYAKAPETFVGSILSEEPGGTPSLLVKGPAPSWATSLASAGEVAVQIVDEQPYSYAELLDLNDRLTDSLLGLGYTQFSTGEDIKVGVVVAEVQAVPGLKSSSAELESQLPADLAAGVQLTVTDKVSSGFEHAYGGARVRNDDVAKCTSGWTVINGNGTTGVTTAGHCTGINQIDEVGEGRWALAHQQEHQGRYGDVEWHTSSHSELAKFYSSYSTLRNTNDIEVVVDMSLNESVCLYGRSSNDRDCSSRIMSRSWNCTIDGHVIRQMVRTNKDIGMGGDSGGGWSNGNTAYGSHVGWCDTSGGTRDVFTPVFLFPNALGVDVRTT